MPSKGRNSRNSKRVKVTGFSKLDQVLKKKPKEEDFFKRLREAAEFFSNKIREKSGKIVLITHHDVDGLTSAALFIIFAKKFNYKLILKVKRELTEDFINTLVESYRDFNPIFIFTDLGSSFAKIIKEKTKGNCLILDHHRLKKGQEVDEVWHVNPFLFGINGDEEITACGVVYLFLKNFFDVSPFSYLPILSVFGDRQEFVKYNEQILKEALDRGIVIKRNTWKFFGRYSKAIYQAIANSTEVYIEGISGNQSAVIELLSNLGIPLQKDDGSWITLEDLNSEQRQKLIDELVCRGARPEEIYGEVIELSQDFHGIKGLRDLSEIATIVNACSRLGYPSIGLAFLLGDTSVQKILDSIVSTYRKELFYALKKIYSNWSSFVEEKEGFVIIHGKDVVKEELLSVVVTILSSKLNCDIVIGYAFSADGKNVKFSGRCKIKEVNLADIMEKCAELVGGSGGGHMEAAGAIVPKENLEDFLNLISEEIGKSLKKVKSSSTSS